jgi:hypothetical protein
VDHTSLWLIFRSIRRSHTVFSADFDSQKGGTQVRKFHAWRQIKMVGGQGDVIEAIPDTVETDV